MEASERRSFAPWPPRCGICGEIMGVYEPLVCVINGLPRETSRAGDPRLASSAEVCYHAACCDEDAMPPVSPG